MVDIEKLKALALAATPGPWEWWTSNSTLRLTGADGKDGGVLCGYVHSGDGDVYCNDGNRAFIEASNPAAVLDLIAEVERLRAATQPAPIPAPPGTVAWAVTAERGGIHKLAITRESAERKAAKWREEWPDNNCQVRPLMFAGTALTDEAKEIERLRETNQKLHRRAQQIEAPAQSYKQRLNYILSSEGDRWVHEFERVIRGHGEIKRIFKEIARAYEYPMNAEHLHSVMDANASIGGACGDGVYANCFLSKSGGMESFRVLDEVRKTVDELLAARAAIAHINAGQAGKEQE